MNEPLKFKLFSVYGQILYKKVLEEAWKHVKANTVAMSRHIEKIGLE